MTNTAENILLDDRMELIDGQEIRKSLPGKKHAQAETRIVAHMDRFFSRRKRDDGTGGWWILSEISIQYQATGRRLIADIAGWKRERVPVLPDDYPIGIKPDWVCEVCHTTRKKDMMLVPETLKAEGVEWYWLVDVEEELVIVYRLQGANFVLLGTWASENGTVMIPPFETVGILLPRVFGADLDED